MKRPMGMGLLALLLCWGCDGPASIEVSPDNPLIDGKGESVQLEATVKSETGKELPEAKVSYESLDPELATVDQGGEVTGKTSGTAHIQVKSGDVTKKVEVLVQVPDEVVIEPASPRLMVGVTRGFKATVMDDTGKPLIAGGVRWSSSNPDVFTVDEHGNVETHKEGEGTLSAFAAGIKGTTEVVVKHEVLNDDGTLTQ